MQFFQYAVQMRLIFPVGLYVQLDPEGVAWKGTPKNSSILCGDAYGIIFGKGVFFTKTCCLPDAFHKLVPWGGKHVRRKRISFQEL